MESLVVSLAHGYECTYDPSIKILIDDVRQGKRGHREPSNDRRDDHIRNTCETDPGQDASKNRL